MLYSTLGWGFQLGANLNWGSTDRYLYTNDVVGGSAVCVRIDIETGEIQTYGGPMYHLAPDESCVVGFPLNLINATQMGYGVPLAPEAKAWLPPGAAEDEGIWKTDLGTNTTTLLMSLAKMAKAIRMARPVPMEPITSFIPNSTNRTPASSR
jgi:hypothetical protein